MYFYKNIQKSFSNLTFSWHLLDFSLQILVVGDPGLGKSQMLLACANVAPRGVFVTATGVTTSGLTVTLSREAGNEFVLEAGALVLADQGLEH